MLFHLPVQYPLSCLKSFFSTGTSSNLSFTSTQACRFSVMLACYRIILSKDLKQSVSHERSVRSIET